jgi:hypothetical protein
VPNLPRTQHGPRRGLKYGNFDAKITAHFKNAINARATVTAAATYKETGATQHALGTQLATADRLVPFNLDVENVEEFTLQVRCDDPGGVFVEGQLSARPW